MLNLYLTSPPPVKINTSFVSPQRNNLLVGLLGEMLFSARLKTWTQLQRFLVPKARSAAFFVLLNCTAVEMRILELLTLNCDGEVAAIKSIL